MASISSLMGSSSSSSIFGSRTNNMITGLASGLDTESMIEGMVQGYQQKILQLQQSKTKVQWQQDAYQSISDKLVEFSRKYTSYAYSTTNLMSNSFFNNAVITTTKGTNADKITASGKSNSNISINSVKRLASSAKYSVANQLGVQTENGHIVVNGSEVQLEDETILSTMDGMLTLTYGTKNVTLELGELDVFSKDGALDTEKLQDVIQQKLGEEEIVIDGNTYKADESIDVTVGKDGTITLEDKRKSGNSVYISGASGNFASFVKDLDNSIKDKKSSFQLDTSKELTKTVDTAEYLADKTISVTLNGQTKQIKLNGIEKAEDESFAEAFERTLQEKLNTQFGDGKIKVGLTDSKLSFELLKDGDTLSVSTDAGELLGIDKGLTSYLNTSKSLSDLLGDGMCGMKPLKGEGTPTKGEDGNYYDENGNRVDEDGNRLNSDGKLLYSVVINDVEIGQYTEDTTLETVLNAINANAEAGVDVSYSKLTNEFVFMTKETGASGRIEFSGDNNLAAALFGSTTVGELESDSFTINGQKIEGITSDTSISEFKAEVEKSLGGTLIQTEDGTLAIQKDDGSQPEPITIDGDTDAEKLTELLERAATTSYTSGQDAEFTATINGTTTTYTRSSNTVEMDGMTITLEGTFEAKEGEEVTFSSKTDTDTIFDTIKQMVTDFNAMATEIKNAYTDQPLKKTDGSRYEPLTAEDEEGLSESEIEAYEEKAKTGILFMDRDLSNLYSALRGAITAGGNDSAYLRSIGIETSYEDGLTTITLDESKLRTALENDLDGVRDVFTKSKENGAASDGLMVSIQKVTEKYAATTGATKGILIEKAGSQYSPTAALSNTMLDKMDEIDKQISSWQSKLSDKVDYYTNKFTQLELLINQMNSQSSALAGLTGGY